MCQRRRQQLQQRTFAGIAEAAIRSSSIYACHHAPRNQVCTAIGCTQPYLLASVHKVEQFVAEIAAAFAVAAARRHYHCSPLLHPLHAASGCDRLLCGVDGAAWGIGGASRTASECVCSEHRSRTRLSRRTDVNADLYELGVV